MKSTRGANPSLAEVIWRRLVLPDLRQRNTHQKHQEQVRNRCQRRTRPSPGPSEGTLIDVSILTTSHQQRGESGHWQARVARKFGRAGARDCGTYGLVHRAYVGTLRTAGRLLPALGHCSAGLARVIRSDASTGGRKPTGSPARLSATIRIEAACRP